MLTSPSTPTPNPIRGLNPRDLSASSLLWRAVLAQAVRDLYSDETRDRLEALRWLKTKDFETVCDFAEVEHTSMRDQLVQLASFPQNLARKYGKLLRDEIMSHVHHE